MSRDNNDDGIFAFLLGMTLGVVGGAAVGLLMAPKRGEEFREDLKALLKTLPGEVKKDLKNPQGKTRHFIDKTMVNLETKVEKVRDDIKASKLADAKRREDAASGYDY